MYSSERVITPETSVPGFGYRGTLYSRLEVLSQVGGVGLVAFED